MGNIKEKTFTPKQRKFFEFIAQGCSRSEAAKKAGYKQPRVSAGNVIQSHTQAFREAFSILGYGIGDVAKDILEGTKANRVISANVIADEKVANGMTTDFIEVPDWNARHKFIHETIDVQGYKASEKHEISGQDGGPVNINFIAGDRFQLEKHGT